jgi:hypothetical protein
MSRLVPIGSPMLPALVAAGDRASMRILEFFAANIRNPHTRRAYARAAEEFRRAGTCMGAARDPHTPSSTLQGNSCGRSVR